MRIVITGNTGYIGSTVAAQLRASFPDAHIKGIDSGWFAHCLTSRGAWPDLILNEQIYGDVRDISAQDLAHADAVIHLAAVSNDPMGSRFETVTDEVNHRASVEVAKLASQAGVKNFVFASSCSVYGVAGDGRSRSERDQVNPLTAYARSKIATEADLAEMNSEMTVTCLRFATACGMSPRLRLDLVLNDFVACALAAGEITVLSDGSPWRPLIHIRDMARAMEWAATRPSESGGRMLFLNVGANVWNYQVRDLAEAVAQAIPGTRVSINTEAPPDKRSYKVDFDLFSRLAPHHQPRETLDSAIAGLRDGLLELGFADKGFRNSQLIRLKVLNDLIESGQLDSRLRWSRSKSSIH
jgi:nucleoside-diphosphate-sugar epimerase